MHIYYEDKFNENKHTAIRGRIIGATTFDSHWSMVFNATFNNISVISWQSVLLVEEMLVPAKNHRPVVSH